MLRWLSIQGLALVDSVELEFAPGLNVLSGETGAGKSLVLGSIGLLLGERADPAWLRAGASRGAVEGTFELAARPDLAEALRALEVEPEEERVVLRREILADGRSRAFVNGRGVLLGRLRAVGDLLVDLHGQHEHQQLLDVARQTDFFDRWAGTWDERIALERERAAIVEERARVQKLRAAWERDRADEDALRADLAELREGALDPEEEESLRRERDRLAHRERLLAALSDSLAALAGEEGGAEALCRKALKGARAAAALDPGLVPLASEMEELAAAAASTASRLEAERERLLEQPLELDEVEAKLDRLHRLKRKHRTDGPGLLRLREELEDRVRALEPGTQETARAERALEERLRGYEEGLDRLAARRAGRIAAFGRDVGALLARLGFGKATLQAAAASADRARPAIDPAPIPALEFVFQPNPGEPPRPLRRIASGGELSRVMLAIKSLMAERDQIAVLVFDEVDQGIGGAVGEEVGRLLSRLGARRQVLCITHLPLIAAFAERHFRVAKGTEGARAVTTVAPLAEGERVEEIARLLAGARATATTTRQARELLEAARSGGGTGSGEPGDARDAGGTAKTGRRIAVGAGRGRRAAKGGR